MNGQVNNSMYDVSAIDMDGNYAAIVDNDIKIDYETVDSDTSVTSMLQIVME